MNRRFIQRLGRACALSMVVLCTSADAEEHGTVSAWSASRKDDGSVHWSGPIPQADEGPQVRRDGDLILLCNERLLALFDAGGQLLGISQRESGSDFLRAAPGNAVWRLRLGREATDPSRAWRTLDSRVVKPALKLSPGLLELEWRSVGESPGLQVRVEWSLAKGSGLMGRIAYRGALDQLGVARVEFPILSRPGRKGALDFVVPRRNWGELLEDFSGREHGIYPSSSWNMQFVGLTDGTHGLYIAAEDRNYYRKGYRIIAGRELVMSVTPPWPGRPNQSFELPYSIVIEPVVGDWVALAKRYRRYALESPAAVHGPLSSRTDLPASFVEGSFWWLAWEEPDRIVDVFRRRLERFGTPSALIWYGWYDARARSEDQGAHWECAMPEVFLEPRKGFASALMGLRELGVLVAPYVNAVSADSGLADYKTRLEPHAVHDASGEAVVRSWGCREEGGPVPFSQMSPAAPGWRKSVLDILLHLRTEYGIEAFYLDQMGGEPHLDFSRRAAHAPGGGNYWARGTQQLLADASQASTRVLIEHPVDAYVAQVAAMLFYKSQTESMIPIHAAVYSDYRVAIGSGYAGPECARRSRSQCDSDLAVAAKLTRAFLWGAQVPMKTGWLDRPEERSKLEFGALLVRARRQLASLLAYGEFRSVVEVEARKVDLTWWNHSMRGRREELEMSSIQAAEWSSPDGERAIVLVNWTDSPARGRIAPPNDWNEATLELCDPAGQCGGLSGLDGVSVPPRSVRLVRAVRP